MSMGELAGGASRDSSCRSTQGNMRQWVWGKPLEAMVFALSFVHHVDSRGMLGGNQQRYATIVLLCSFPQRYVGFVALVDPCTVFV